MDTHTFTILSLCSGAEGLELGLKLNIPNSGTICHVEIEAYVCALLEKRMREKVLADAPIWTNLKSFDGKPWRGLVDCLTAGYPCQPFSIAGKKLGDKDPRHLWPEVARVISECEPAICFLENVGAHLRMGFEQVHDDLRAMGYRIKSGLFTAEEVGSPHKRERLFILAYSPRLMRERNLIQRIGGWQSEISVGCRSYDVANDNGWRCIGGRDTDPQRQIHSNNFGHTPHNQDGREPEHGFGTNGKVMADGDCNGRNCSICPLARANDPQGWAQCLENAFFSGIRFTAEELSRHEERLRAYEEQSALRNTQDVLADTAVSRAWEFIRRLWQRLKGNSAKLADTECDRRRRWSDGVAGRQSGEVEAEGSLGACDGLPAWPPRPNEYDKWETIPADFKPAVHRMADGLANRLDRVRTCGNGVVPLVAAYAFRVLCPDCQNGLDEE